MEGNVIDETDTVIYYFTFNKFQSFSRLHFFYLQYISVRLYKLLNVNQFYSEFWEVGKRTLWNNMFYNSVGHILIVKLLQI